MAATSPNRSRAPKKRRPNWRRIKVHFPYTVDKAAKVTGMTKGTVRRWIDAGNLPAITDKRPHYILGADLRDYLASRSRRGPKMPPDVFRCFKCKTRKSAALGMADYIPLTESTGNLRTICECGTLMHKVVSKSTLGQFAGVLEVTIQQGPERLTDSSSLSSNDHFKPSEPFDA